MKIIKADIRNLYKQGKVVCVTTNGFIKKSGEAVMGRGNALAMAQLIPQLPINLANHIKRNGNVTGFIYKSIIAFPVKPIKGTWDDALDNVKPKFKVNDIIPGFWCKASPLIIRDSLYRLNQLLDFYDTLNEVYLPIPGCSNGGLKLEDIQHILEKGSSKIIYCSL